MRASAVLALVLLVVPAYPAEGHVVVRYPKLRAEVMALRDVMKRKLPTRQWRAAKVLWDRESHWNPRSGDPPGCYGIPQSCPARKMRSAIRPGKGPRWDSIHDPFVQGFWGMGYVKGRYGSFVKALRFQTAHGYY